MHARDLSLLLLSLAGASFSVGAQPEEPFAQCDGLAIERPAEEGTAACFRQVAARTGQRPEARARLEEVMALHPELPWPKFYLARLSGSRRIELYEEAKRIFAASGETQGAFRAQLRIALAHDLSGDLVKAEAALEQARGMLPATMPQAAQRLRSAEVAVMISRGDLSPALLALRELSEEAQSGPLDLQEAVSHRLGYIYYELGQNALAKQMFDRATEAAHRLENRYAEASHAYMRASVHLMQATGNHDWRRHAREFESVAELAGSVHRKSSQAGALLELGRLQRDPAAARRHLEAGLEISEDLGRPELVISSLGSLAYLTAASDPRAAELLMQRAVELAVEAESSWAGAYLWFDRLPFLWRTRPPHEAYEESLLSLEYIEALRLRDLEESDSASFFSVWASAYSWLAGRLLTASAEEAWNLQRAFEITEKYRSRVLLDRVQSPRDLAQVVRGDQHAQLSTALLDLRRRLLREPAAPRIRLAAEARERQAERRRVLAAAPAGASPAALIAQSEAFTSHAEVQRSLAEDEALLSFQVAADRDIYGRFAGGSWLIAISKAHSAAFALPDREEINSRVSFLLGLDPRAPGAAATEALEGLYGLFLRDALEALPASIRKLIIVPDGELHDLPFGLLRPAGGEPLESRYQISIVPSATLWREWRRQRGSLEAREVLVMADPSPPVLDFPDGAPSYRGWRLSIASRPVGRLRGAREEGLQIRRLAGHRARLRLGPEASEEFFKAADLDRFGIIHIAAHAQVNDSPPFGRAVLLAAGEGENGRLEEQEIVDLELDGQLVVLAACRGADGDELRGEGAMSLSRAFFVAGARAVIASLWPLDDAEARDFFVSFYGFLGRGLSVGEALREAKVEAMTRSRGATDWAGIVVFGDSSLRPLAGPGPGEASSRAWSIAICLALALYTMLLGLRLWNRRS